MAENEKMEQAAKSSSDKASKKGSAKPSFFDRIGRWLREMKSELKKVAWPTGKQTMNNTMVVIFTVIVVGIFIWVFDWAANGIISALISLFG
ncbi:MAG: preprotein translocase subunit SecE [Oscillospiraceae bacterium]|jgi:preprotein translocase subunit SecE|nr:preprotein translocase subunit SecE [Oscillospiraceae bacterium]MCI9394340.1 preprotein translocase subunit SecE [Oscillospiraceae bacterium]MCI9581950.1 preprotein translocase subunit SecE [Oscillospiraceae bacterium]